MRRLRSPSGASRLLVALTAGGAMFAIATAVQASIPDANGVIHACYNTSIAHGNPTGALRVIDTSKPSGSCSSWETPLNWLQAAPPGPTGPAGPTGLTGPKGATGPTGPSGTPDVWSAAVAPPGGAVSIGSSSTAIISKTLPAGKFLIEAKVGAHDLSHANYDIFCSLSPDSLVTQIDNSGNGTTFIGEDIDVPLEAVVTLSAQTTETVWCSASSATGFADWAKMAAIPLGTIH